MHMGLTMTCQSVTKTWLSIRYTSITTTIQYMVHAYTYYQKKEEKNIPIFPQKCKIRLTKLHHYTTSTI